MALIARLCYLCLPFVFVYPICTIAAFQATIDAIYQFGDSTADTGNLKVEDPTSLCSFPPYGETYFGRPTGRCSDGFLMVDFFAKTFHLPLLNPYLMKNADFTHGVNFAVAGATALDPSFLATQNITVRNTNNSLSVQLGWFKTHLNSACSSKTAKECMHRVSKALFVVGSIGGNDYMYALLGGKSIQELYQLVPSVVKVIKLAVEEVIHHGATRVLVPGYDPLGCTPSLLSAFASNADESMYDEFKCLKIMNVFTEYHNQQLQKAVKDLQDQHPSVAISYGDTYSAFIWLLKNAPSLGFEEGGVLKACCGSGNNAYNVNSTRLCGMEGVSACPEPKKRVSWDGFHLTHQAHKYLAGWLLTHIN